MPRARAVALHFRVRGPFKECSRRYVIWYEDARPEVSLLLLRGLGLRTRARAAIRTGAAARAAEGTRRRTQFIWRNLPIAILVKLLQSRAGVCNFLLIDHAVVIGVESAH